MFNSHGEAQSHKLALTTPNAAACTSVCHLERSGLRDSLQHSFATQTQFAAFKMEINWFSVQQFFANFENAL